MQGAGGFRPPSPQRYGRLVSVTDPVPDPRSRALDARPDVSPRSGPRSAVFTLLVAYGLVQVGLECHDLYLCTWEHHGGDPSMFGMPSAHEAMLNAMSGSGGSGLTGGYLIKGGYSPILEFISQLETAYALLWLVVLALFLAVVAVLWREGRRWSWIAGWMIVVAHLGAAACFGPYSSELMRFHVISAAVPAGLLIALTADIARRPAERTDRPQAEHR